ncbi:MAG: hypothetical protein GQ527_10790 [Bacteroidales bacterium]|nr:hypothetical protein [Bacteroidales bacterium]
MKKNILQFITIIVLIFGLIIDKEVKSQVNVQDSCISSFVLYVAYAYQVPGGDMADRYGHNSTIGPGLIYKTNKNWMWTAELNFLFGNDVINSDSIISQISTDDGHVIGIDGTYVNIRPMERGFTFFAKVGKIIPAFDINPNSGMFVNVGLGYIQHKIRWDVEGNGAPQLDGDYKNGYDRFTEGIAFTQSIGFFHMADKRLWNFHISAEVIESFTKMKRYNFDTFGGEPESRIDLFYGLKISWMIPLYGRAPKAIYYY